ncbi:MAG: hypothetical protein EHM93_05390 [Bacteroidales bacterium]|nr:MAG: hypothetical protein EHM93_05390 [Bacteroidales bacterium]
MLSIFQIKTIAHFEAKTLFRSWFFRILGILMLTIVFFFNLAMVVFGDYGDGQIQRAVPSAIPYSNLMFFNVVQAIIAVFLASDFLKRDKKLDTTEVIYTRSMSNGDYIIGKLLGNLFVFTTLNFVILGMALIFNLILGFSTVNWIAYIYYFLLVSVPTLIYIIGLSFILMNLIKNQAVTFAVLIGYIFLTLFYLQNQYYYVFDYMVYNIPMLYSDLIGFIDLKLLVIQRGMYLLLGLSFISLSVYRLWRLPNKPYSNLYPIFLSVIFLIGGVYLGSLHVRNSMRGENLRGEMLNLNDKYASNPRLTLTHEDIKLNHKGKSIEVECILTAVNHTSKNIDTIVLSLNPSLLVSGIWEDKNELTFSRKEHLIQLEPKRQILPNESITLKIVYNGTIDDEACYIDIDKKTRDASEESDMVNIGKIYSRISDKFVLLTPENNWYPTTTVGFNKINTLWMLPQFCKFNLSVQTSEGMVAVSQGAPNSSTNITQFTTDKSLTGLSLVIGPYKKISYNTQEPEIGVYLKPNHDYFNKAFPDLKDTIQKMVYKSLEDYSLRLKMPYPFKRLFLVEVPIQVQTHQRFWSNHMEMLQPELIFVHEKGGQNRRFNFESNIKDSKDNGDGKSLSAKDLQEEEFKKFLASFTRRATTKFNYNNRSVQEEERINPYFVFDQFYAFNHQVESKEYPVFNTILGSYCLKQASISTENKYTYGFSEEEKAVLLLQKKSLSQVILNPDYYSLADNIINMKGDVLLSLLEKKIGKEKLDEILNEVFTKYNSRAIPFEEINNLFKNRAGQDLSKHLNLWLSSDKLPAFRIGKVDAYRVTDGERQRFLTRLSIANEGAIEGIVKIAIREAGSNESSQEKKLDFKTYDIEPNQIKTISILTDKQPTDAVINTNASMNIPVKKEISILKVEGDGSMVAKNEEKTTPLNRWDEEGEIIVDNEDSLFSITNVSKQGLLIRLANKIGKPGDDYQGYMWWSVSGKWNKFINNIFYGKYLHSAVAIRSGGGNSKVIWNIPIEEKGQYDIYTFIPKDPTDDDEQHLGDYQYTISHDDGESKVTINCKDVDSGWVLLGTYYCSQGNTKVELNNESKSRVVIADAIKAVKL